MAYGPKVFMGLVMLALHKGSKTLKHVAMAHGIGKDITMFRNYKNVSTEKKKKNYKNVDQKK